MEQNTNDNSVYSTNNENYVDFNILQMRLDTSPILKKMRMYLQGTIEVYTIDKETNSPVFQIIQECQSKANREGINSMMNWFEPILSSLVVQGNLKDFESLNNEIANLRLDFSKYLMLNMYKWNMQESDLEGIIDSFIFSAHKFISRLVGDKERQSYAQSIVHKEHTESNNKGSGLKLPF